MTFLNTHYRLLRLHLDDGSILCRHYDVPGSRAAVIWLGGVAGGFDSPAGELYDRFATTLLTRRISSLHLKYRAPRDLESSIGDAMVGAEFLSQRKVERILLIGHAFGGAVAIQAGALLPSAVAVATLASQNFGTTGVAQLSPRPLLLIHGADDPVLPPECSQYIFENAKEPKRLVLLPNCAHQFDEAEPVLRRLLDEFICSHLERQPASRAG